jgi:uncharacterized protein DUF1552
MRSFRFARRSFLAAIGGAVGLRVLLDNMVASAAGATSPPRFLMTHWPVGTVRYLFRPTGTGASYTASKIIQPFIDAGLKDDMSVFYGFSHQPFNSGIGGGHESGTPMMTTGCRVPGTRANGGEHDDGVAGGPSFDQVFLKNVPELQTPGPGYINAICDARVDSLETSTQCLSYGYATRSIAAADGGNVTEATPLLPELSPLQLYLNLFADFMPGGATPGNQDELLRAVKMRKSVLDYALTELNTLGTLAPASEKSKIDSHAAAIRTIETQLQQQIDDGVVTMAGCMPPTKPDSASVGSKGGNNPDYTSDPANPPMQKASDEALHEKVGNLHMDIIIAAFQCDLRRVATFQWSPGTNHVSFKGQYPGRADAIYMHHPTSHLVTNGALSLGNSSPGGTMGDLLQFLGNIQTWYNSKHAALLNKLKAAKDSYGNSLLDHTVVPYITEVAETTHTRSPLAGFIFGGKALGMTHGSYYNFEGNERSHNDLWMTVAQAYLGADPLSKLSAEKFDKKNVGPIAGVWKAPV